VNWTHLRAFVWLRWRLAVNQTRRSGPSGALVTGIVTILVTVAGGAMLIAGLLVGSLALRAVAPNAVMAVWDGVIVAFLFFWLTGLIVELQRSDSLSLDRFLYLPVSPGGAFLINYLASSLSLSLILMLPAMSGLAAGLVASRGLRMLLLFPLVAAFFLMMTAVTYQFRGWLASLMESPRRRRTILAVVPIVFILLFQLPSLLVNFGPGARGRQPRVQTPGSAYATAHLVNMIAPPGWLAYGAEAATEARVWPALAAVLGMGLVGALSLRRAYLTTLRLYRGDFDKARRPASRVTPAASPAVATRRSTSLMEWQLPWVSQRVSSVAVTSFRSWMRAPETKTALLTPLIMLVVFARMLSVQSVALPELVRAVTTSGLAAAVLIFGMIGPIGNQFGYDRAAFLAFVLGPAARRDILLGKNLALLPFAMGMMVVVVGVRQWFNPLRLDHFMAVLFQLVTMFLLFCLAGNLLSIVAPIALKPGSGMPAGHQGIRSFGPLLFMIGICVLLGLTLFPAGIEAVLRFVNRLVWFPAYLVFNVVQTVVVCWLYRRALDWEGELLQRREPRILEIVASRVE
jgi:hypothetical protein